MTWMSKKPKIKIKKFWKAFYQNLKLSIIKTLGILQKLLKFPKIFYLNIAFTFIIVIINISIIIFAWIVVYWLELNVLVI